MKHAITAIGFDLYGVVVHGVQGPDPAMLALIGRLRRHGYRVGLLSNSESLRRFRERYHGLDLSFDAVVLSGEIGAAKPDTRAYLHLSQQLAAQPDATVYVDDMPANVAGADAAGLHGIRYAGIEALVDELHANGVRTD